MPILDLSVLQPISTTKSYRKGQMLFSEGDTAQGFWRIEKGAVRLYALGEQGREVGIHRFESGQIVGAAIALAALPYPHFGEICEASTLRFFPTLKALPLIVKTPDLATFFLTILAGKCTELTSRITSLQMQSVRERLLYFLGESCPKNSQCSFRLPLAKKELALQLGTTPETLSRTFALLEEEGILQMEARNITMIGCLREGRCQNRAASLGTPMQMPR